MKKLQLVNLEATDNIISPEQFEEINLESPAVEIFTDFKVHKALMIDGETMAITALQLMLKDHKFFMILDESHKIKNPVSNTGEAIVELAKLAKRRLILTGTPMPNFHKDLWNQFEFLFPYQNLNSNHSPKQTIL